MEVEEVLVEDEEDQLGGERGRESRRRIGGDVHLVEWGLWKDVVSVVVESQREASQRLVDNERCGGESHPLCPWNAQPDGAAGSRSPASRPRSDLFLHLHAHLR